MNKAAKKWCRFIETAALTPFGKTNGNQLLAFFAVLALAVGAAQPVQAQGILDEEPELRGIVESLPPSGLVGDWVVSGVVVHVTPTTWIEQEHGLVRVGALVEVKGWPQPDRSFTARKVEVKSSAQPPWYEQKLYGYVQSLPASGLVGDWTVSGVVVHVLPSTLINQEHGLVQVGALVEVEGYYEADRSFTARKVEVKWSSQWPGYESKILGVVQSLPATGLIGDWVVGGVVVHVSPTTVLLQEHGLIQVGALVEAEGRYEADRSFTAFKVEVKASAGTNPLPAAGATYGVLKLQPTAQAPVGAEGKVVVRSFAVGDTVVREDLKVGVEHLMPQQLYDVFVDGVFAGAILTNNEGEGYLFLSSQPLPASEPLPSTLSPVTQRQRVEVQQAGAVILAGNFADARWDGDGISGRQYLAMAPLADVSGVVMGVAVAEIKDSEQKLELVAFTLPPSTSVRVVVDGFELGVVTTLPNGQLRATFSTAPDGNDLLLPQDALPVTGWHALELRTLEGQVLANGSFFGVSNPGLATAPGQVRRHLGKPRD